MKESAIKTNIEQLVSHLESEINHAQRIQGALTDLGLPNEYWAYAILFRLCNDVMHARVRQFSADNPPYTIPPIPPIPPDYANRTPLQPDVEDLATIKRLDLREGLSETIIFLGTLTDDDISHDRLVRMLNALTAIDKTL